MERVFVDTSLWFEAAVRTSRRHGQARGWLAGFEGRLTTSSDVVNECMALIKGRFGNHAYAVEMGRRLRDPDLVQLVYVEEPLWQAAWEIVDARPDKGYSLVDCTSFVIMERMGLKQAATFDRHFAQEGFEVVPA